MRDVTDVAVYNPPHPEKLDTVVYVEPKNLSARELAAKLGVAVQTLNRVLTGANGIGFAMALRLSKALGRSPESWLSMQYNYDLWQAKERVNLRNVSKAKLTPA